MEMKYWKKLPKKWKFHVVCEALTIISLKQWMDGRLAARQHSPTIRQTDRPADKQTIKAFHRNTHDIYFGGRLLSRPGRQSVSEKSPNILRSGACAGATHFQTLCAALHSMTTRKKLETKYYVGNSYTTSCFGLFVFFLG